MRWNLILPADLWKKAPITRASVRCYVDRRGEREMTQSTLKGFMVILFGIICATGATGGGALFGLSILAELVCFAVIDQLPKE